MLNAAGKVTYFFVLHSRQFRFSSCLTEGRNTFYVREHILRDAVQCNLTLCKCLVWPGNDGGSFCLTSSSQAHSGVIKGCFCVMVGYIP